MKVAYLVKIKGRVTGVGFRYSAVSKAAEFRSITGYVRNVQDGEVETIIQGEKEDVERMLEWLRRGPDWARVDGFSFSKVPFDEAYTHYHIK